jgi:LmbE family N-acetylglucosaminyl deacetylase
LKDKLTVIFFTPHADDIELGTPFMYIEALRLGNRVIEVLMTNNEFGTRRDEFKGHRLRKIREKELENANNIFGKYTKNKVEVIRMGYIDGYLPFNKDSFQKVIDLIRREKPAIIFAPDFWYAQDFHVDHLNTGRLVYFSLKRLEKSELPHKVFYYYSTRTRYYLKCQWKDFKIVREALSQHKSQYTPLETKRILVFYNKLSILRHLLERKKFSESFREQKFSGGKPISPLKFKEMSLRKRIIYYTFSKITIWGYKKLHNITPEELGLR